jgi:copper chaperone CopZ
MKREKLTIKGMHCKSCEILISEDLEETGFIKNIKASTKEGTVEFEYNEGKISLDKIKTIVEEAGEYKVE